MNRPAPENLRVSVRELRLMTGRALLTTAIPFGGVAATRDVVVAAETHGLGGISGLLAALDALRARHLRPELNGPTARFPALDAQPPLATAADLLDLAVAGAHAEGSATFAAAGHDWAVRALAPLARRHGVALDLTATTVTASVAKDGPMPGPDAAELRALTYGLPVAGALWQRLVAAAEEALTPDSALSRTHAGDSLFGPDGQILAEVGEDEPVEVAS
ncbi:hypothetical protein ABZY90_05400 [Streptomyces sp. NPDC006422]|uniref:hypothetical protein n=1 Tax=unclassified Streptomyces TaxID=2593676 RepID=UPI0033B95F2B